MHNFHLQEDTFHGCNMLEYSLHAILLKCIEITLEIHNAYVISYQRAIPTNPVLSYLRDCAIVFPSQLSSSPTNCSRDLCHIISDLFLLLGDFNCNFLGFSLCIFYYFNFLVQVCKPPKL